MHGSTETTNLRDLELKVRELAAMIGAETSRLPTFGYSDQTGRPHIEVDGPLLHYVVCERGREFDRTTVLDVDQLLWHVFSDVTHSMAIAFEAANRRFGQDHRRPIFAKQSELLAIISDSWAGRIAEKHHQILADTPYDDASDFRSALTKKLMNSGQSPEAAWESACEKYPLPRPVPTGGDR